MLYPPTLNSSQTAFLVSTPSYPIYFTLNKITSYNEIGHIQIRVTKKDQNTSVINTNSIFKDGIIYLSKEDGIIDHRDGTYSVNIDGSNLIGGHWISGQIYKVQLRFGSDSKLWGETIDFATWKKQQIDMNGFSEWSTVMLIKAIDEPRAMIVNSESGKKDPSTLSKGIESTTTPLFMGQYEITPESNEIEDKYCFELYQNGELLETTGWLQHTNSNDTYTNQLYDKLKDVVDIDWLQQTGTTPDEYRFKQVLLNEQSYTVKYKIKTVNGYLVEAAPYDFLVNETTLNKLNNIIFEVEDSTSYCIDNGCMNLYITGKELNGCYVITRTDEKSNFTRYEDLKYLFFFQQTLDKELIYQDFTIESGIKYKYAFQLQNSAGVRTRPLYEDDSGIRMINFEYSYLYHDNIQLKLMLNQKLSSFKHTVLQNKQDTLGSKYPFLTRNGYAYYAEFPISGTISFVMDNDQTFFTQRKDGYYYQDELVIPRDKFIEKDGERAICQDGVETNAVVDIDSKLTIDRNLTPNNFFVERKFREKAEEFLNNFEYKLYKSPSEGNIVVALHNVSLTPNPTLGRMIFDFSATAYEVLDNTLETLDKYQIINIGEFTNLIENHNTIQEFGQISGMFKGIKTRKGSTLINEAVPTELLNLIKQQEEVPVPNGYRMKVNKITGLCFQPYPRADLNNWILELEAEYADLLNNGQPTEEVETKLNEYYSLQETIEETPQNVALTVQINGKDIVIMPNRMYKINEIEEDVQSIKLKYTQPIIVNYICDLIQVEDKKGGIVSQVDVSRLWGQISGIFTENEKILKNYNYKYAESETYRIYNLHTDGTVIKDDHGNIIVDNTNINLYSTINLFDIIKQECKIQIETNYNIANGFNNYDETTDQWDSNGDIYYHFDDLISFDIEADPGTILYIGESADNYREIAIGPTGKYTINPSKDMIQYVMFNQPTFAIVNYICNTTQTLMKKE